MSFVTPKNIILPAPKFTQYVGCMPFVIPCTCFGSSNVFNTSPVCVEGSCYSRNLQTIEVKHLWLQKAYTKLDGGRCQSLHNRSCSNRAILRACRAEGKENGCAQKMSTPLHSFSGYFRLVSQKMSEPKGDLYTY